MADGNSPNPSTSPSLQSGGKHPPLTPVSGESPSEACSCPKHLDPRLEDDGRLPPREQQHGWRNHRLLRGKGQPRDIIFEGNPTRGCSPRRGTNKEVIGSIPAGTPNQGNDEDSQRQSFYARRAGVSANLIDHMTEINVARETGPAIREWTRSWIPMLAMMAQNQTDPCAPWPVRSCRLPS